MEQLEFYPKTKEERLELEVANLKELCDRMRKGQFAKIGALAKSYNEIKYELETLKAALCRGNSQ